MFRRKIYVFFCLILWACLPVAMASAQEKAEKGLTIESVLAFLKKDPRLDDSLSIKKTLSGLFRDPETINTINQIWQEDVITESRFLSDLNLKFKTFKVNNENSTLGLGFSYSYSKDITRRRLKKGAQAGLSLSLKTEGNVAFEKKINPEDFLDSAISFHLFKSWGGTVTITEDALKDSLNKWETDLAMIEEGQALLSSPLLEKFVSLSKSKLRDQFYTDFSFSGGLESNQDFSITQSTYGANLGLDLKLWKNDHWNIFDWPFAAIRWLSGYDKDLAPIGGSFPTVMLGVKRVSSDDDMARLSLADSSDYTRINGEIAFRTPISSSSYFEANLRYYKELSPSVAIKNAKLDEHIYFTAALTKSDGMFVSYTTGKLPFDTKNDQIYQLGFKYNF